MQTKPPSKRKPKSKAHAENSVKKIVKRRGKPRGKPFEKGNAFAYKPGVSGNPGGRPKLLSDAYRRRLAEVNEKTGLTYAETIAIAQVKNAAKGEVQAAKEIRAATEGTWIKTWKDEIIDLLKSGAITAEQAREELGDDADELVVAAGADGVPSTPTQETSGAEQPSQNPATQ